MDRGKVTLRSFPGPFVAIPGHRCVTGGKLPRAQTSEGCTVMAHNFAYEYPYPYPDPITDELLSLFTSRRRAPDCTRIRNFVESLLFVSMRVTKRTVLLCLAVLLQRLSEHFC